MDRVPYSPTAKDKAYSYIIATRYTITLPVTDAMEGMRFKSNDAVYVRLESMYPEVEFMRCPRACVEGALIDAAQSDYWYCYEKSYEDDYEETNEEDYND